MCKNQPHGNGLDQLVRAPTSVPAVVGSSPALGALFILFTLGHSHTCTLLCVNYSCRGNPPSPICFPSLFFSQTNARPMANLPAYNE